MTFRILILFLLAGISALQASNLSRGMSLEDVRIELGRPESKMELGSKQILIYGDGTRLEFQNGKLVRENDQQLGITSAIETKPKPIIAEPILETDIIQPEKDLTITASIQLEEQSLASIGKDYESNYSEALDRLEMELESQDSFYEDDYTQTPAERLTVIGISFGIEVVVTLIVLSIAFSISGFPSVMRQLVLLSLAVALVGAMLDFVLHAGLGNPVRSGAGFIILLILIRQMTDVREWATAIKIAIIARLVSMAIMWIVMVGLFSLFSL